MDSPVDKGHILIVDDEADILELLETILIGKVSKVSTATDGAIALKMHSQNPADVIVSDLNMPVMNGIELLQKLRESGDETPFIVLTGCGDMATTVAALRYGAFDFLSKPFSDDDLVSKITEAIAMHKLMKAAEEEIQLLIAEGNLPKNLKGTELATAKHVAFLKKVRQSFIKS